MQLHIVISFQLISQLINLIELIVLIELFD